MGAFLRMRHIFHPEAGAEFEEAVDYYEERRKGLGRDFAKEVCSAIVLLSVRKHGLLWKTVSAVVL